MITKERKVIGTTRGKNRREVHDHKQLVKDDNLQNKRTTIKLTAVILFFRSEENHAVTYKVIIRGKSNL